MKSGGGRLGRRGILSAVIVGCVLLAGAGLAFARSTTSDRGQLEAAACVLMTFTPTPISPGQTAVAMPTSTLVALSKSGNATLERVVHAYDTAAASGTTGGMIRALDSGVRVCHRLGLPTAGSV